MQLFPLIKTNVKETIYHEAGHFLIMYFLFRNKICFYSFSIEESNGKCFFRVQPDTRIDENGFLVGWEEVEEYLKENNTLTLGFNRHCYSNDMTAFEIGICLCAGKAAEVIRSNKKRIILEGSDKEKFKELNLNKQLQTACKRIAFSTLYTYKKILQSLSEKIFEIYTSQNKVVHYDKQLYPRLTLSREQMEGLLLEVLENNK